MTWLYSGDGNKYSFPGIDIKRPTESDVQPYQMQSRWNIWHHLIVIIVQIYL